MTRILICKNPNSKFKGQLRLNYPIAFVFDLESENTIFPIHSSLYELLNDGWEIISEKESDKKPSGAVMKVREKFLQLKKEIKQLLEELK